jgi:hypothetical protein
MRTPELLMLLALLLSAINAAFLWFDLGVRLW